MKQMEKPTLRHGVSQSIRESIFNNELKPGDRIVETKIAKQLGVSQSPVREAIRELVLMGLIENKPFQGCFVKKLSKKDIKDAYKLRAYLEMLAAFEAAKNVTDEQLEKMESLLKRMRTTAEAGKVKAFVELDISFHKMIINIADNSLLENMWEMVNLAQWTFITTKISQRSLPDLANRHEEIYKSLKKRDSEEASKCIKAHIEELEEDVLSKIDV
ncbi:MAG: hypothetical protein APF77_24510 [Clostridia bacterium BRH_c25]|nr:MAG: hypothetical protein APF77_24510 [Clostridia bacterium BRH_c25]